jgi:hypothetical protein
VLRFRLIIITRGCFQPSTQGDDGSRLSFEMMKVNNDSHPTVEFCWKHSPLRFPRALQDSLGDFKPPWTWDLDLPAKNPTFAPPFQLDPDAREASAGMTIEFKAIDDANTSICVVADFTGHGHAA